MGALIAYQLTRRLLRQGDPLPTWLGVSAYGAPRGEADADGRPHLMSDDELRGWLRSKEYISPDNTGHNMINGWKAFDRRWQRTGTYTWDLSTRVKN
jgi:surfactin synthase thioesterase subunit